MSYEEASRENRYVFQFWHSGIENAPPTVLSCIESWKKGCDRNDFQHVIISKENLHYWEDQFPESIRGRLRDFRNHAKCWEDARWRRYSNMLRLALLNSFNGIWADSTLLLMKPLEEWLPEPNSAGGLQLCKGATDRLIENWFICSLGDSPLLEAWLNHYVEYNTSVQRDASQYLAKKYSIPGMMFRIQRHVPGAKGWWFAWFLRTLHRRHPYFANYYSFEYVYKKQLERSHDFQVFLPYDLTGWSFFNSHQQAYWTIEDVNPTLFRSLSLLPFIKLDWKRSPNEVLSELNQELLLSFLWNRSSDQLSK